MQNQHRSLWYFRFLVVLRMSESRSQTFSNATATDLHGTIDFRDLIPILINH